MASSAWGVPLRKLRRELNLQSGRHPLFEDRFSPDLVLALFSPQFAKSQADWPRNTKTTGFVFYSHKIDDRPKRRAELAAFLAEKPGPILFTLGSAVVHQARQFFEESIKSVLLLGLRAVLLVGNNQIANPAPDKIAMFDYVPYSDLFPFTSVVVHQGGIGTTAQALRAGRPMLVVPRAYDQPDNGARIVRLEVGRLISERDYLARRVAKELRSLLDNPVYRRNASAVAQSLNEEDGLARACTAIEQVLQPQLRRIWESDISD
jgi:UDP:flavonoid glycosyltransferase YjiC (YdhE family)